MSNRSYLFAGLVGLALLATGTGARAQVLIERTVSVNALVPDGGSYRSSVLTWTDANLINVNWTAVTLNFSSGSTTSPMVLGDLSTVLRFGTSTEGITSATVFSRGGLTNASQTFTMADVYDGAWKSSGRWELRVTDGVAGGIAKLDSWKLSVRGDVNTNNAIVLQSGEKISTASDASAQTTVSSALSFGANTVSAEALADKVLTLAGGISGSGTLQSTAASGGKVVLSGNSTGFSGTVQVGGTGTTEIASSTALGSGTLVQSNADSTVAFSAGGTIQNAMNVYNVAFTANGTSLTGRTTVNNATFDVANGNTSTLSGKITGSGGVTKTGLGTLLLAGADANDFTGASAVNAGTMVLQKSSSSTVAISGSTIALNGGTLLLGQANQISDATAVTLNGGALNTAGFADQVGVLRVTANSTISGLVTSAGGVATGSDFLFSSVDLSDYSTSSGAVLTLSGVGYGQSVNLASSNYTGWSNAGNLNNFTDKIQFGSTGMKASISFNGTTGLTYITAIPEPKVYVAIGILCALVGWTEYRRRRCEKKAAARI